jgi:hypothetical protein
MKRCAISSLLVCLCATILLLVTGCDNSRDAQGGERIFGGVFRVGFWNEHLQYYVGERVHIRATLTNISKQAQIWGDTEGITPVLDINVRSVEEPNGSVEKHIWSQEHSDEAKYRIALKPGESYIITWEFTPSLHTAYYADAKYNLEGKDAEDNKLVLTFFYGIKPPGPLP